MESVGRARGRGRANLFNLSLLIHRYFTHVYLCIDLLAGQTESSPRPGAFANAAVAASTFSTISSASSSLTFFPKKYLLPETLFETVDSSNINYTNGETTSNINRHCFPSKMSSF